MKKFGILILICFCLTGCFDYYELNNVAICTGLAIDKYEDKYEVTYLISNAKKTEVSAKDGEAGTTTYNGVGVTVQDAINDLKLKMPFEPYNGHLIVAVISDEVARDGIDKVMDLLARDTESRDFFYMLLANGSKARDILEIISPLSSFPSQTIAYDVETSSENSSLVYKITYNEFLYNFLEEGKEPVLNSVSILGDLDKGSDEKTLSSTVPKATIKINNFGVFKNNKLLGFADGDETRGINLLTDNASNFYVKTSCLDSHIVSYVESMKSDTKIDLDNNKVNVKISGNATIMEVNCDLDLEDPKVIQDIGNDINEEITNIINKAAFLVQKKYNSDVLGYGMQVHKKDFKKWKEVKDDWDNIFKNLEITSDVNINVKTKGSLTTTIGGEKK